MRDSRWIWMAAILGLAAPLAHAEELTCDSLPDEAQGACKGKVAKACTMTDYWPKRKCEDEIVRASNPCEAEAYRTSCEAAVKANQEVCTKAEVDWNRPADVSAWMQRRARVAQVLRDWKEFAGKHKGCFDRGPCRASARMLAECAAAGDAYQKSFNEQVTFYVETRVPQKREQIAEFVKQKRFANASGWTKNLIEAMETTYLVIDPQRKEILALRDALKKEAADYEQKARAELASVKCPAEIAKNDALKKTLQGVMSTWFASDDEQSGIKETVEVFRMGGKPAQTRNAIGRVTFDDAPVIACVRQVRDGAATCRIFKATVRREKPDGGSWSDWKYQSIGGGDELLCENLKR